jgi:hypothetical protein
LRASRLRSISCHTPQPIGTAKLMTSSIQINKRLPC